MMASKKVATPAGTAQAAMMATMAAGKARMRIVPPWVLSTRQAMKLKMAAHMITSPEPVTVSVETTEMTTQSASTTMMAVIV